MQSLASAKSSLEPPAVTRPRDALRSRGMGKRGSESKQGNDCTKAFPPHLVPPASLRPPWGLAGGAGRKAQGGHRRAVQDIRVTETAELADRRRRARGHGGGGLCPSPAGSLSTWPFPPSPAGAWPASSPSSRCYLSLPVSFPLHHAAASAWALNNNEQGAADSRK